MRFRLSAAVFLAALLATSGCLGLPQSRVTLSGLSLSEGTLTPDFSPQVTSCSVNLKLSVESVNVTPAAEHPDATITVNGAAVPSGGTSDSIALNLGENVITVQVAGPARGIRKTYTISVTRGISVQEGYLKASNTGSDDEFGYSVAVSGDTLVVGAPEEDSRARGVDGDEADNTALQSGAAYVFVREGSTWTQEAYLKASNTEEYDEFGHSVAISGDTIVVGAPNEDSNATGVNGDESDNSAGWSGAAYVFVREDSTWSQEAYLKASDTKDYDYFGYSVAVYGDTVAVGAYGQDNSGFTSGAAYVFVREGSDWSQEGYLMASNGGGGDRLGWSIAVSIDTVVVGAPWEESSTTGVNGDGSDNSAYRSGAAYVFVREGSTWTQQAYLKASNTDGGDGFGGNVAISGDTIVVGADGEDSSAKGVNGDESSNGAPVSGAAYVFVRSGSDWSQEAYLKASNTEEYDEFGHSVAISGDTILVGAGCEDSNATGVNGNESNNSAGNSGAASVFVRSGSTWSQEAYLKPSNTGSFDYFGWSVAVSGDTAVVGAWREDSSATGVNGDQSDNGATGSGAAYVFR